MREIIKVLLQEGIDEDMIHRVLDLIEEEYEVIDETKKANKVAHQEAIFKELNPNGKETNFILGNKDKKGLTNISIDHKDGIGTGVAHTLKDVAFTDIRNALGRDDKFSKSVHKKSSLERVKDYLKKKNKDESEDKVQDLTIKLHNNGKKRNNFKKEA